jgi:hypothetical protein
MGLRFYLAAHVLAFASSACGLRPSVPSERLQNSPEREGMAARNQAGGFRVIARKVGTRVKLYSRPGNDLTYRFSLIVNAVLKLRAGSCIIDGEAVACGANADHLPDDLPIRSLGPCMACARCGHRGADVRPDWRPMTNKRHG